MEASRRKGACSTWEGPGVTALELLLRVEACGRGEADGVTAADVGAASGPPAVSALRVRRLYVYSGTHKRVSLPFLPSHPWAAVARPTLTRIPLAVFTLALLGLELILPALLGRFLLPQPGHNLGCSAGPGQPSPEGGWRTSP